MMNIVPKVWFGLFIIVYPSSLLIFFFSPFIFFVYKDCSTCHKWFIRPSANSGIPIPVRQPMKINRPPVIAPVTTNNNVIVPVPVSNAKMPKFWSTNSPVVSMKNVPKNMDVLNELVIAAMENPIEDNPISSSPVVIDSCSNGNAKVQCMPSIEENNLNSAEETIMIPSSWSNPHHPSTTPSPTPPKGNNRNPNRPQCSSRRFGSTSFDASAIRQQITTNDMVAVGDGNNHTGDPQETNSVKQTWKNAHSVEFEVQHPASVTGGYPIKPPTGTRHSPKQGSGRSKRILSSIPTFRVINKSSKDYDGVNVVPIVPDIVDMTTSKGRKSFVTDSLTKAFDWFFPGAKSNRLLLQQ